MPSKKRCEFRASTDAQGSDTQGSDAQGSDAQGSDAQGSDAQGSDAQGSDAQGSNAQGTDSQGSNAQGTDSQCKSAALRIAGQCALCRAWFCSDHRLPEHHSCNNLEDCRKQAFEVNRLKLEAERTVAPKMVMA